MKDSYVEILVKRQNKPIHFAIKIGMLVVTVVVCLAGLIVHPLFLLLGIVLLVVDNFALPMLDVEYEYLFVDGELTVDKILGKNRRKKCFEGKMEQAEIVAPVDLPKLSESGNLKCTERDYTSGNEEARVYACIFRGEKEVTKLLFEPNDQMLELMYLSAPRKVVRENR